MVEKASLCPMQTRGKPGVEELVEVPVHVGVLVLTKELQLET